MSTYYYMACEDHKLRIKKIIAVIRIAGSHIDNSKELLDFMLKHRNCCLKFFSEHDDKRYAYEFEQIKGEQDER